jgi:hypothetical protein
MDVVQMQVKGPLFWQRLLAEKVRGRSREGEEGGGMIMAR